ncbi:MAG: hypothetical protein ACREJ3_03630 [Polyangiaceae bacterium]
MGRAIGFVLVGLLPLWAAACGRGCARKGLGLSGGGDRPPGVLGSLPLRAMDCPDGLARCEEGVVSVSLLGTVPMPCHGPPSSCVCRWESVGECSRGCAAEGIEVVMERGRAMTQMCAPGLDEGSWVAPARPMGALAVPICDEGGRYLCAGGAIIECASGAAVAQCSRGCVADGGTIDEDGVTREAAFALLCSR